MAQKDYVSRAKKGGRRKKPSGKSQKTVKKKNSSPIALLLLVGIVAAFITGLYFLKNNKLAPTMQPGATTPSQNSQDAKVDQIPPAPAPRWDYIDALTNPGSLPTTDNINKIDTPNNMSQEQQRILSLMAADRPQNSTQNSATYNQQVDRNSQNDRPQAPATSQNQVKPTQPQNWMLQCGAFKNKEGAESIKAQLALSGISSQIVFSSNTHRVLVGPYKTKDAAGRAQTQLNNSGIKGCNIRG